ncbi:MAG: hypothetical protein GWM98_22325, partial [Nitrospinaceae bacterium]|nr:hypothetical protein [Nitrospinaceae bacterium]NIR56687.1 hypothetical protein [Nitrospinaceae bacterium]NIT84004.1 hypothetical protein [Nitrospinaceae bacterium]NIU46196.1 hypothetical protein [Nitrospinaceae bacterium]NIU98373.1 hypothetical protein [Nitrospinaceae bacterium]
YRTRTHNIESKKNVYLVRTGDGHLKMRIINYYCKRAESDCQTSMCPREEAACLSIEYLHIKKGERTFPVPTPALAQNAQARP